MAEVCGASIAPHCPLGQISLAASLQVAFTMPNFLIQQQSTGMHYHGTDPAYLVDMGPVRAVGVGHAWRSPVRRHDDGGFAEW